MGNDFHDGVVNGGGCIIGGFDGLGVIAVTGIASCQQAEDQQKRDRSVHN